MPRSLRTRILAAALLATIAGQAAAADGANAVALDRVNLRMIGLTADQRLISFREQDPADASSIGFVTGLVGGDAALIGIDYRVQDGKLYGVGNAGGVYLINSVTAAATLVNRLSVALSGSSFGVDFNPAADRLRIVSNNGQNLRHNVNAGGVTITDAAANYVAGTPASGVTGSAYTNNDLRPATATTLFNIDITLDQVAIQAPPNSGSLSVTGKTSVDAVGDAGFDIYSASLTGSTFFNTGYAVLTTLDAGSALYHVDVLTGKATKIGAFDEPSPVVDLAIPLAQR